MSDSGKTTDWKGFCSEAPRGPGIYKFLDRRGKILYVGKAKSLRSRLSSWLLRPATNQRHHALLSRLASIDLHTTSNEIEALLLESNLIKEHQPDYNVLLKDNKSYPWIHISDSHEFPGVFFFRGARRKTDSYFGPYPSTPAVRRVLKLIYKVFKLRQCTDGVFQSRHRPCIQHQIGNCEAPCVGLIGREAYLGKVKQCKLFLRGKGKRVISDLDSRMREAAARQDYEGAADIRDSIEAIQTLHTEQAAVGGSQDIDFIVAGGGGGAPALAQVLSIRGGINLGLSSKRLSAGLEDDPAALARLFIIQHYRRQEPPPRIVTETKISDGEAIGELLARYHPGLASPVRLVVGSSRPASYLKGLQMASANLQEKLASLDLKATMYSKAFTELGKYIELGQNPRIDCMDVSHLMGKNPVCSSVSCDARGRRKDLYRLFNLSSEHKGNDLAALTEALGRKLKEANVERDGLPEVLLIDGGVYQWQACHQLLVEHGLEDGIHLLAISKHDNRKLGMEFLHFDSKRWLAVRQMAPPLFRCLLDIRNEAHRFAISAHREQRRKSAARSRLDGIAGIGPKRQQMLLSYFRGIAAVQAASIAELRKVPGISEGVAERIHSHFQGEASGDKD